MYAFNKIAGDKVILPDSLNIIRIVITFIHDDSPDVHPDKGVAMARTERRPLFPVQRDAMGFRLAKGEAHHDKDQQHHRHRQDNSLSLSRSS